MSIKALTKITDRGKKGQLIEYKPGDTIENLQEDEERRLLDIGAAEIIETNTLNNSQNVSDT